MAHELIVTTGSTLDGYRIAEYLGVVRGIAFRAPTPMQGLEALGKFFSGGLQAGSEAVLEVHEKVCEAARAEAHRRMVRQAEERGADAVIGMRYDATSLDQGITEVLAYGTAVKFKLPEVLPT